MSENRKLKALVLVLTDPGVEIDTTPGIIQQCKPKRNISTLCSIHKNPFNIKENQFTCFKCKNLIFACGERNSITEDQIFHADILMTRETYKFTCNGCNVIYGFCDECSVNINTSFNADPYMNICQKCRKVRCENCYDYEKKLCINC